MAKTAILHIRVEPELLVDAQAKAIATGLTLTEGVTVALRRWLGREGGEPAAAPAPQPRPTVLGVRVEARRPPPSSEPRVAEMTMAEAKAERFARMQKAR